VYEWRDFTTVEDLKKNGLYVGNGLYYAGGEFGGNPRPATLYGRTGICTYASNHIVNIATGCKYLVDDGNFVLVKSQNGKSEKGIVKYNNNYGVARVLDDNNVIHVGLLVLGCGGGCVHWGNYIGEQHPDGKSYEALIYKPLAA
jgi:hypothetical protein